MSINIYPSPHVDVGDIDQRVSISQSLVRVVDIDLSETQGMAIISHISIVIYII